MRVATIQLQPLPDPGANLAAIERWVSVVMADEVVLAVFPEMCIPGYWHLRNRTSAELRSLGQPLDGPWVTELGTLARTTGVAIGAGILEREGDELFNTYVVCMPDQTLHRHRKLHAFEHPAISSGDSFTVFDTPWGVRVGVLICWDNNLVENVRITALLGAEVLLAPHQTGGTRSRSPHGMRPIPPSLWQRRNADPEALRAAFTGPSGREWLLRWLPARAHDNGLFVIFSNGVGLDDDEVRTGTSMIIDPYGRIVAETDALGEAAVVADLDLDLLPLSTGRRWIAGRRPELYAELCAVNGTERDARAARFDPDPPARPGQRR